MSSVLPHYYTHRVPRCLRCCGTGWLPHTVIPCLLTPMVSCDHPTHMVRRPCYLCRGSRRADIFTILYLAVRRLIRSFRAGEENVHG